ncbi:MAG: hypothetical protein R2838_04920 [Caldilineaceae bacterium]
MSTEAVAALVDAVAAGDIAAGLTQIQALMVEGASLNEFCQQVVEHLRGVMLLQMTGDPTLLTDLPGEVVKRMQAQAEQLAMPQTLHAVKRFSEAIPELKGGYQPQLPLEMALIEAVQGTVAVATQVTVETPAQTASVATSAPVQPRRRPLRRQARKRRRRRTPPSKAPRRHNPSRNPPRLRMTSSKRRWTNERWPNWRAATGTSSCRRSTVNWGSRPRHRCGPCATSRSPATRWPSPSARTSSRDMIATPEMNAKVAGLLATHLARSSSTARWATRPKCSTPSAPTAAAPRMTGPDPLVEYAVSQLHAQVVEDNEA